MGGSKQPARVTGGYGGSARVSRRGNGPVDLLVDLRPLLPPPRRDAGDLAHPETRDTRQHIFEVPENLDTLQPARLHDRVDRRRPVAASFASREEPIFSVMASSP